MVKKCKHGVCWDCGQVCQICGLDVSKYNIEDRIDVCPVPNQKVIVIDNSVEPDDKCPRCGKELYNMTAVEKDRYFDTGVCCK